MRVWSVTDRGLVRSENQDACAVLTPDGYTVAVVCDGMGGTQGGRMASAIAVETFTRELSRSLRPGMSAGQLEQAAGYAVALSNDAVREYGLAHPDDKVAGNVNDVVLQRHADAAAQVLLAEDRR